MSKTELLKQIRELQNEYAERYRELTNDWVQQVRKYPDGFTFQEFGETVEITGAEFAIEHASESFEIVDEEELTFNYTVYVHSFCSQIPVEKKPNHGIPMSEYMVDYLIEHNATKITE
jgi:hypothetical protein